MDWIKKYKIILIASIFLLSAFFISKADNKEAVKTQSSTYAQEPIQPSIEVKEKSIASEQSIETINEQAESVAEIKNEEIEEIKTEDVDFETINQNDSTLEKGKTEIKQKGIAGIKELKYAVIYADGRETSRKLVSETVKVQPVDKIVLVGTKEKQITITSSASCGEDYYKNVDGNCIHRPSDNPSGATAKCKDGSYSYSQHRQGTCSGHSGVAEWL